MLNEPAITGDQKGVYLGKWIEQKREKCSMAGNLSIVFLAAIIGGPFAVLGAFMASNRGWYGILYIVIVAPVIEELLKQSGMIWSRAGSSATLALRIAWLNKRWEQLWQNKPLAA